MRYAVVDRGTLSGLVGDSSLMRDLMSLPAFVRDLMS